MEILTLANEEAQYQEELKNQYSSMGAVDLLKAHDQWLWEVDVEYEIVD